VFLTYSREIGCHLHHRLSRLTEFQKWALKTDCKTNECSHCTEELGAAGIFLLDNLFGILKVALTTTRSSIVSLTPIIRKAFPLFLLSFLILVSVRNVSAAPLTSTNWSGYVVIANGVTGISASWIIPPISSCVSTVAGTEVTQGISVWIGFDGYSNNAIPEQIGTNSYCYNGSPTYLTWEEDPTLWGTSSNHEVVALPEQVYAGDHITASIEYQGNNYFQLKIADSDVGGHRSFTVIVPSAPRGSAEWIVEAFTNIQTQSQVSLPTFRPITFSDCTASVNNAAGSITQNNGQLLDMVDNNGNVLVEPQNLNQAGTSFQVAEVG